MEHFLLKQQIGFFFINKMQLKELPKNKEAKKYFN